jgi:Zn-dependent metalloprotease
MARPKSVKAKADLHPRHGVPRRLYEIESAPSAKKPREVAQAFLKKVARDLQIAPDLSQLKFDKVKQSLLGSHVLFQQQHAGQAVSGAWVRVDIDREGRVYNVQNDLIPQVTLKRAARPARAARTAAPALDEAAIREAARAAVGDGQGEVIEAEACFVPRDGVPRAAWKVIVVRRRPRGEWKLYLDPQGVVFEIVPLLKHALGQGRVFDPNPVVRLNDTSLSDTAHVPDAAYSLVSLPDVAAGGTLDGPFVTTRLTTQRVRRKSRRFVFRRGQRAFKEVMVYFHIDRAQRHIQSLGFDNVLNKPVEVDVDGTPDDNSFYSPTDKSLTFGTGGVDDAEDADIILHEYGHAIQDDQVPGFGQSRECGAMGEGFGDFLAASFFSDAKPQALKPTVGNWDAVAYSGDEPPCLRRLDSNKKYPRDMHGEVHDDGEIWSACLWEVRAALGRLQAERLVIAHHFLLTRTASFEDAAEALLTADRNLNGGQNGDTLRGIFVRRGILPNAKRGNRRAGVPFAEAAASARRRRQTPRASP